MFFASDVPLSTWNGRGMDLDRSAGKGFSFSQSVADGEDDPEGHVDTENPAGVFVESEVQIHDDRDAAVEQDHAQSESERCLAAKEHEDAENLENHSAT